MVSAAGARRPRHRSALASHRGGYDDGEWLIGLAGTYDASRTTALHLLDEAAVQLGAIDRAAADAVDETRRHLLEGRVSVAVVGEFKRGKSSLLAALIEEPDLFPTDVDIATSLVTSVEYAESESIDVYLGTPADARPEAIPRLAIRDYVTEAGNPGNERGAQLLRVRTPSERLRDGLVVLDTPGVGGLNPKHAAATYAALGSADVVLFVIDALTPMTREEVALLERIAGFGASVLVAVTKIDKVTDYATVVDDSRVKLARALGGAAAERTAVVPVSSAAKLEWLDTGDDEALEFSNFADLEDALGALLVESGGGLLVDRSLAVLARHLDRLLAPLTSELMALTESSDAIRAEADRLDDEHRRLHDLAPAHAGWRTTLATAIEDARGRSEADLLSRLAEVGKDLERGLAAPSAAGNPEAVLARVESEVTLAWIAVARRLALDVARIGDDLERLTGLHVNPIVPEGGALAAFLTFGGNRASAGDDGGTWAEILSSVAGLATYLLDGSGVAAMAVNGLTRVLRRGLANRRRVEAFAASAREQLARASRELRDRLDQVVDSALASVREQYEQLIAEQTARVSSAAQALDTGAAGPPRSAAVSSQIEVLSRLQDRARAVHDPDRCSTIRVGAV